MATERMAYECSGIMDGWKIVSGEVKATTVLEARQRFRRKYKRPVTSIQAWPCRKAD